MKISRKYALKNIVFLHIKRIRSRMETEKLLAAGEAEKQKDAQLVPKERKISSMRTCRPVIQSTTRMSTHSKTFSDHLARAHIHASPPLKRKFFLGRNPEPTMPGTRGM